MNQDLWESVHVQEQERLRWKIKLLNHKLARRDRRIKKQAEQLDQLRRLVASLSRPNPVRRRYGNQSTSTHQKDRPS